MKYYLIIPFSVPINCLVSVWSEWGPLDDSGISRRERTIIVKPLNGGKICPVLKDSKNGMYFIIGSAEKSVNVHSLLTLS